MRMSHFDWTDCVVENSVDWCLQCIRFEHSENDDSRTLHVPDKDFELLACVCYSSGELQFMFGTYTFVNYSHYDVLILQGLEPA